MYNYKSIFSACFLAILLSCSGNFEPIPSESRAGASTNSIASSSSAEEPSSSGTEESSSSSVASSDESSSSITPSSSSNSNCSGFRDNPQPFNYGAIHGEIGKICDKRDDIKYSYVTYKSTAQNQQNSPTWMAENLNYNTDNSRCYNGDPKNCDTYGRLYSWTTAMNNICPDGWHLPNNEEWCDLANYAGVGNCNCRFLSQASSEGRCNGVSNFLKEDRYNFLAKLGGYYEISFQGLNESGNWWSKDSAFNNSYAWAINSSPDIIWNIKNKNYLYSVRCVKDTE